MKKQEKEREKFLDEVIKRYGFEDRRTLQFARLLSASDSDWVIKKRYEYLTGKKG